MRTQLSTISVPVFAIAVIALSVLTVAVAQEEAATEYTRDDYQNSLDSGLYEEAGVAAKARLQKAIREGKARDLSTVPLLEDLAQVQRLSGDYATAIQNYDLAVEIIEDRRDMLDINLTGPLLGLGRAFLESGRADLALDQLERSLHVRSVNEGPHSIAQAETLEVMADAYRSMGKTTAASDAAERLYLLYVRKYSEDGIELVPVLLKQGHILGDIGDWRRQRNSYVEAMNIVERAEGKDSTKMIRPLVGMGNSHAREYFAAKFRAKTEEDLPGSRLLDEASSYFESAYELTSNASEAEWRSVQDALLAFGDFYTMTDEQSRARNKYREAWELLSGNEERLIERERQLEQISPLLQPEPDLTVGLSSDVDLEDTSIEFATGRIVTQFTVTLRGKLRDIGLVEIVPDRTPRIEEEVKRALTGFVYRPRFAGGSAVDTTGILIQYEFPYLAPDSATE